MIDMAPSAIVVNRRSVESLRETEQKRLFREIARQPKDRRALGVIFILGSRLKSLFTSKERLSSLASTLAGLMLLSVAVSFWTGLAPAPPLRIQLASSAETTPVAAFVAAFARGDEAAAEHVASPLYRAEWARRGLSMRNRGGLAPRTLSFTYVGQVNIGQGFHHLLYVAQPAIAKPDASPSVWRFDTDPRGQVIWAELVYLFDAGSTALAPVGPRDRMNAIDLPSELVAFAPRLAMGVRSTTGREGYFAVMVQAPDDPDISIGSRESIVFFGVDAEGTFRPGVWSYGQAGAAVVPYGEATPPPAVAFDAASNELRRGYQLALGGLQ